MAGTEEDVFREYAHVPEGAQRRPRGQRQASGRYLVGSADLTLTAMSRWQGAGQQQRQQQWRGGVEIRRLHEAGMARAMWRLREVWASAKVHGYHRGSGINQKWRSTGQQGVGWERDMNVGTRDDGSAGMVEGKYGRG